MPYAKDRAYCDADSHIMETVDWLAQHTDPNIVDRLPELNLSKSGTKSFDFIHDAVNKQKERALQGAANGRTEIEWAAAGLVCRLWLG